MGGLQKYITYIPYHYTATDQFIQSVSCTPWLPLSCLAWSK